MKKIALLILAAMTLVLTGCSKEKIVINGIEDLNGKKIGVQGGTTGEAWVQDNVDGAKISSFKSGIDAALDLKSGAIDVVVLDELPAIEIVNHNSDLMIVRSPVFADNREEYAIAVKKGNDKLLASINKTINDIKASGDYDKLMQAFMPADGNIKVPEAVPTTGNGSVKLGTNAAFPPFEYVDGKISLALIFQWVSILPKLVVKNLKSWIWHLILLFLHCLLALSILLLPECQLLKKEKRMLISLFHISLQNR